MCICDLKNGEEKLICNGNWNTLYIERDHDEFYLVAKADGNVSMRLNYCPECGRVLNNELEEELEDKHEYTEWERNKGWDL